MTRFRFVTLGKIRVIPVLRPLLAPDLYMALPAGYRALYAGELSQRGDLLFWRNVARWEPVDLDQELHVQLLHSIPGDATVDIWLSLTARPIRQR